MLATLLTKPRWGDWCIGSLRAEVVTRRFRLSVRVTYQDEVVEILEQHRWQIQSRGKLPTILDSPSAACYSNNANTGALDVALLP